MRERGITFTKPMVQAERAGCKTETRRLTGLKTVNEQPDDWVFSRIRTTARDTIEAVFQHATDAAKVCIVRCPYGNVGDRLYVKESLWIDNNYCPGLNWGTTFRVYAADERSSYEEDWFKEEYVQLVTGRFMYKEMARTWLEVVDIRVERLRDITDAGALAEGIRPFTKDGIVTKYGLDGWNWSYGKGVTMRDTPKEAYLQLFASINKKSPPNPFVFLVKFKRLEHGTKAS